MTPKTTTFFKEALTRVGRDAETVVDIGGALRISRERGDRYDSKHEWMRELLSGVEYKILDPVDTYHPDIVGDVHALPFEDNSQGAIVCVSVLEHVENPIKACAELYRVLRPGGYLLVYVPFLYYYHAERGYYKDYWRFTEDTLHMLFKDFSEMKIETVRGAIETLVLLLPFGRHPFIAIPARFLDRVFHKTRSKQTSGFNVFLVK